MTRKRGGGGGSKPETEGCLYDNVEVVAARRRRCTPLQRRVVVNSWRMNEERLSPTKARRGRRVKAHLEELSSSSSPSHPSGSHYWKEVLQDHDHEQEDDGEEEEEGDVEGANHRRRLGGSGGASTFRWRPLPSRRSAVGWNRGLERPTPSVQDVWQDLSMIVWGYTRQSVQYWRLRCWWLWRWAMAAAVLGVAGMGVLFLLVVCSYYLQVTPKCRPPAYFASLVEQRPFVEYYVHGRGNGHYARSVAIVESLNQAGVDVRLFVGRATMWRAMNEAKTSGPQEPGNQTTTTPPGRLSPDAGVTTVFAVSSTVPSMPFSTTVSHILERMNNDCEVSARTGRYPDLVVSDGDFPGMGRAYLGGIPSVGISHGQSFSVGRVPPWVQAHGHWRKKWKSQRFINYGAAFFTDWQIGTNFLPLESSTASAVIASSPMRPDVITMAQVRRRRRRGGREEEEEEAEQAEEEEEEKQEQQQQQEEEEANPKDGPARKPPPLVGPRTTTTTTAGQSHPVSSKDSFANTGDLFPSLHQHRAIQQLLQLEPGRHFRRQRRRRRRRRLVICYFRDKNGDVLQSALLKSGFDVLLFERGYHKGLMNIQGVEKYGHQYILHPHDTEEEEHPEEGEAYWRQILPRARLQQEKLLTAMGDDDEAATNQTSGTVPQRRRLETFTLSTPENHKVAPATTGVPKKTKKKKKKKKKNTTLSLVRRGSGGNAHAEKRRAESDGTSTGGRNAPKTVSPMVNSSSFGGFKEETLPTDEEEEEETLRAEEEEESLPPPKIIRVTDMSLFVPLMAIADGVASSAGSQLISECIYANIPLLALYRENDDEQMFNVEMIRHYKQKKPQQQEAQASDDENRCGAHLVHGISLETFTNVFEFALGSVPPDEAPPLPDDGVVELLPAEEQARHLRTSTERGAYQEFTAFVHAVTQSRVSRSFFHEVATDTVALASTVHDAAQRNAAREAAFPGMPDAASVILEIVKQVTQEKKGRRWRL